MYYSILVAYHVLRIAGGKNKKQKGIIREAN